MSNHDSQELCSLHTNQLDSIEKKLSGLIKTIYGNGGPGLLTKVAVMENQTRVIVENSTKTQEDLKSLSKAVWIGTGVMGLLQALVIYLVTK